jgi:hypothetical protein
MAARSRARLSGRCSALDPTANPLRGTARQMKMSGHKKSRRKPQTSDGSNAMDGPITADPAMCETFCTKGIAPMKVYPLPTSLSRGMGSPSVHWSAELAPSREVDQCQH